MQDVTQIQISQTTKVNRYPAIFTKALQMVRRRRKEGARVLSFGCSTGEECITLADLYFTEPNDQIVGVDIARSALAAARATFPHPRISYLHTSELGKDETFDAIFAMSVLCRWPDAAQNLSINEIFPFRQFEEACSTLDERLNVGGILSIVNANYRFTDLPFADRYTAYDDPTVVHVFNPEGARVRSRYYKAIFRKNR